MKVFFLMWLLISTPQGYGVLQDAFLTQMDCETMLVKTAFQAEREGHQIIDVGCIEVTVHSKTKS